MKKKKKIIEGGCEIVAKAWQSLCLVDKTVRRELEVDGWNGEVWA